MQTKLLGPTGVNVSALCLGTMRFGTSTDEPTSFAILDAYEAAGGSFLDTANVYAAWGGGKGGESEAVIGRWFKARGNRDRIFLASKVGSRLQPSGRTLRYDALERECENSLRRLGVETIDLYYAHFDDATMTGEEIMEAFHRLVRAGKVRHIAASNYYTWRLEQCRVAAVQRGGPVFCCVQQRFSYVQPVMGSNFGVQMVTNEDLLGYLRNQRLPLMAYSPLMGGLYDKPDRELPAEYAAPVNTRRLTVVRSVAVARGVSANQVVLAWMLQLDPPVIPLIGASSVDQLKHNLAALDIRLTDTEIRQLNLDNPS